MGGLIMVEHEEKNLEQKVDTAAINKTNDYLVRITMYGGNCIGGGTAGLFLTGTSGGAVAGLFVGAIASYGHYRYTKK